MNINQLVALQGLVHNVFSEDQQTELSPLVEAKDYRAIASTITSYRFKELMKNICDERDIVIALGPTDGINCLHKLYGFGAIELPSDHPARSLQPAIAAMVEWLRPNSRGLDVGDSQVRQTLQVLAAIDYISADHVNKILALGEKTISISPVQVAAALLVAEGDAAQVTVVKDQIVAASSTMRAAVGGVFELDALVPCYLDGDSNKVTAYAFSAKAVVYGAE